jgi:hypothetical protein
VGLGFDEVELVLGDVGESGCYNTISDFSELNANGYYAKIVALPDYDYYYIGPEEPDKTAFKLINPLYSNYSGDYGSVLTLCSSDPTFKVVGESFATGDGDYWLGRGGVYMITLPGVTNDPLYFSFPFGAQFWYHDGPDMRIFYEAELEYLLCYDEIYSATKEYYTQSNNFYNHNILDPFNTRYIVSTDKDEIESYWKDNWFYIGLSNSATILGENGHSFEGTFISDEPIVPADLGEEIVRLETGTGFTPATIEGGYLTDKFEIVKEFPGGSTFVSGTQFYIYVNVFFENGENVDSYRLITYSDIENAAEIRVFFRGKMNNYTAILYEVD